MRWRTVGGKALALDCILGAKKYLKPSSVTRTCGEETLAGKMISVSPETTADWVRPKSLQGVRLFGKPCFT